MDTIFAPITAVHKTSIITLRISGQEADKIFKIFSIKKTIKARYAHLCELKYADKIIDKALLIYFPAPNSFTGEDIIEISIHGSLAIYKQIIAILANINGFRWAEPGEFSKRAFLNNKLDLLQAEAINDLIKAQTTKQSERALAQLQGKYSNFFLEFREKFIEIRAYLEAFIDFPDEDIPEEKFTEINNIIGDLKYRISKLQQNFNKEKAIMQGINISIIGPVNAGKSSLINYLVGKEVSIVSDIAGTTRDLIEVNLDLAGYAVTLIDTAGLREYSNDKIEQIGINKTKEKAANSDFKILLLAADQIAEIANYQDYIDANSLVVINKCELNTNSDGAYANITKNSLKISVKKQLNLDLLLKKITTLIAENYNLEDNIAINKERHYNIVNEIYVELAKIDLTNDLVIIAEILRRCTFLLEKIVGLIDVEDILDKIFLSFCIGK